MQYLDGEDDPAHLPRSHPGNRRPLQSFAKSKKQNRRMFAIMQRYRLLKPSIVVCSVVLRNICCSKIALAAVFSGFAIMQLQLHRLQAIMQDVLLTESGNGP
ncbi:hypothetical protein [Telluria beijingensis]|uniref:hypothetical protein n=1 Tax=Telluria beijingensis TaxID=3068633 RepID=UPI0027956D3B|nr:hypothetical protein [Massilia sp. REN29]